MRERGFVVLGRWPCGVGSAAAETLDDGIAALWGGVVLFVPAIEQEHAVCVGGADVYVLPARLEPGQESLVRRPSGPGADHAGVLEEICPLDLLGGEGEADGGVECV